MANSTEELPFQDIVIVGAGPAGLSLATMLSDSGLSITLLDIQNEEDLASPQADGREIALNHASKELLEKIGAWQEIQEKDKHLLNEAKVENGRSPLALEFRAQQAKEPLGYLIANHQIRQSLFKQLKKANNIRLLCDTKLLSLKESNERTTLMLSGQRELSCKLLIAADSRFSATRKMKGIAAKMKDYGRVMIVCNMQHELDHQHIAQECFHYGHTCAILPLGPKESSIVITVNSAKAEQFLQLDDAAYAEHAYKLLSGRLGKMTISTKRQPYPLVGAYADRFTAPRFALIGDAAVGMHPVTAHGFNLGLHSAHKLSKHILKAHASGKDYSGPEVLKRYAFEHQLMAKPVYEATNLIVGLFNDDSGPAKLLRKTTLGLASRFTPLQKLITHRLTRGASKGLL
ncbi:5-demethoxyubiquinol-8 5-hydroxylase UbiM [uncultured Pseudoteredinibacter sp.]|uniref:5-demethoxyubiquinol-8 5-hydroxylase UbiM n=1 Tax=uncultured Pseudoteredinibacter sp. TaxID=1641701 RepID=UPI002621F519|nr:5-demethoxyubiquinol-8 5-hydroxylase UbiM [uncultured Pseudoteredinibacter sp.]